MITDGTEMEWNGHILVYEENLCAGCFFADKGECPKCEEGDEGVWVEENPSTWHTGTPSEEGWYLLHTKETIPYRVAYMRDNRLSTSDSYIRTDIVIEWQKIKEK